MILAFVSYSYQSSRGTGFGRTTLQLNRLPKSGEEVRSIEQELKCALFRGDDAANVCLMNYIKMDDCE